MMTTRREWLAGLLGLPFIGRRAPAEKPARREFTIEEFHIAGFQYHEGPQVLASLREGQELRLANEPENPHDDKAVRIEFAGHHLGYVPRTRNKPIFRLIGQDAPLRCVAVHVNDGDPPWFAVWVRISVVV